MMKKVMKKMMMTKPPPMRLSSQMRTSTRPRTRLQREHKHDDTTEGEHDDHDKTKKTTMKYKT